VPLGSRGAFFNGLIGTRFSKERRRSPNFPSKKRLFACSPSGALKESKKKKIRPLENCRCETSSERDSTRTPETGWKPEDPTSLLIQPKKKKNAVGGGKGRSAKDTLQQKSSSSRQTARLHLLMLHRRLLRDLGGNPEGGGGTR